MFSSFLSSTASRYPAARTSTATAGGALVGQHLAGGGVLRYASAQQLCERRLISSPALHRPPYPSRQWLQKVGLPTVATLLGAGLVTVAILYAPLNSFDDLDCLSDCQQCCSEGRTKRELIQRQREIGFPL